MLVVSYLVLYHITSVFRILEWHVFIRNVLSFRFKKAKELRVHLGSKA